MGLEAQCELYEAVWKKESHSPQKWLQCGHHASRWVFIVGDWNLKLISYEMDHKLMSVIETLEMDTSAMHVVPYVPYFSESPALTNKH